MELNFEDLDLPNEILLRELSMKTKIHLERLTVKDDDIIELEVDSKGVITNLEIDKEFIYLLNFFNDIPSEFNLKYEDIKIDNDNEVKKEGIITNSNIETTTIFLENSDKFTIKLNRLIKDGSNQEFPKVLNVRKIQIEDSISKFSKDRSAKYDKTECAKKHDMIIVLKGEEFIDLKLCDELIKFYNDYPENKKSTTKWSELNNVHCRLIELSEVEAKSNDKYFIKKSKKLDAEIFKVVGKVVNYMFENFGIAGGTDSGYCLRKIFGSTRPHTDGLQSSRQNNIIPINNLRCYSLIIGLNDDYDGGEFYFPYQDFKHKLKKGEIIIFPPYWTHRHLTYPLNNQTYRYTINTWLFEQAKLIEENKDDEEIEESNENKNIEKTNDI